MRRLFLCLLLAASPALATTYWVSPAVNNAECASAGSPWSCCTDLDTGCVGSAVADCSEAAPCTTVEIAMGKATPTTINVLPGTYAATFSGINLVDCGHAGTSRTVSVVIEDQATGFTVQRAPGTSVRPVFDGAQSGFKIRNTDGATISGIKFTPAALSGFTRQFCIDNSDDVVIDDVIVGSKRGTVQWWPVSTHNLVSIQHSDDVTVQNSEFYVGDEGDTGSEWCGGREFYDAGHWLVSLNNQRLRFLYNTIRDMNSITSYSRSIQEDHDWIGNHFINMSEHGIVCGSGCRGMLLANNLVTGRPECASCEQIGGTTCGTCVAPIGVDDACWRGFRWHDYWECPTSSTGRRCVSINNTIAAQGYAVTAAFKDESYPSRACETCEGSHVGDDCLADECRDHFVIANNFVYDLYAGLASTEDGGAFVFMKEDTGKAQTLAIGSNYYAIKPGAGALHRWHCRAESGDDSYTAATNTDGGCNVGGESCSTDQDCIDIGRATCDNPPPAGFYAWRGEADCNYPDDIRGGIGDSTIDTAPTVSQLFADYAAGTTVADYALASSDAAIIDTGTTAGQILAGGCSVDGSACTVDGDCTGAEGTACNNPLPVTLCYPTDILGAARSGVCTPGAFAAPAGAGSTCGDGVIDGSEDCDPGGDVAGDCCDASCAFVAVSTSCEDGLYCTTGEVCSGSSATCPAGSARDCDDAAVCTTDTCNDVTDACEHTYCVDNDASCSDTGIEWDATTASGALTPTPTATYNHTAAAGSNVVAVIFVYGTEATTGDINNCIPTSVAYDGNAATIKSSNQVTANSFTNWLGAYVVALDAEAGGTEAVLITWPNSNCDFTGSTVTTLSGVTQGEPVRSVFSSTSAAEASELGIIATPIVDGDFIVDGFYHRGVDATMDPAVCDQLEKGTTTGTGTLHTSVLEATATDEPMTWTLVPERPRLAQIAVVLIEATAPAESAGTLTQGGAGNISQ